MGSRCSCAGSSGSSTPTAIQQGAGITITGTGTSEDPYIVTTSDPTPKYESIGIAAGDETTAMEVCVAKVTFRMPFAMTLWSVRASLTSASTSGTPTVDINESGVSILSTKLTIDVNEKTSVTAAVPAVISDTSLAFDAEITVDIDVAGANAAGLKVWLIGTRT